jgi:hypothetical protein
VKWETFTAINSAYAEGMDVVNRKVGERVEASPPEHLS